MVFTELSIWGYHHHHPLHPNTTTNLLDDRCYLIGVHATGSAILTRTYDGRSWVPPPKSWANNVTASLLSCAPGLHNDQSHAWLGHRSLTRISWPWHQWFGKGFVCGSGNGASQQRAVWGSILVAVVCTTTPFPSLNNYLNLLRHIPAE